MSGNGYIPSFKMWLFSIFLAAGFGSGAVDGIKYLLIEYTKKAETYPLLIMGVGIEVLQRSLFLLVSTFSKILVMIL